MTTASRRNSTNQALKNRRIFIGGPIQNAIRNDEYGPSLRSMITSALSMLEDNGYEVFSAHRDEEFGLERGKFSPQEIAMRDFDWMNRCACFLAILPISNEGILRTDGTHIELGWASALGKPIILVAPLPLPESCGQLLRGMAAIASITFINIREFQTQPDVLLEALDRHFHQNTSPKIGLMESGQSAILK